MPNSTLVLTPIVLCLAVIGYIQCIARFMLPTFLGTGAVAAYLWQIYPPVEMFLPYWIAAAGALCILFVAGWRLGKKNPGARSKIAAAKSTEREIVVDGTNVLYWDGEKAELSTLQAVVVSLVDKGYYPYIFFDASSRHHLKDKSLTEKSFARQLGLPQKRVMVCPAKTDADAFILKFARDQKLPVVSNDRFGDRAALAKGTRLVKGVIANGKPIFEGF